MKRKEKFSIRKLSFGAASVLLGFGLYSVTPMQVLADETTPIDTTTEESEATTPSGIMKEDEVNIATYNFYGTNGQLLSSQRISKAIPLYPLVTQKKVVLHS